MELTYIVISVIEVILTFFIIKKLNSLQKKVEIEQINFENKFKIFYTEFQKFKKLLNISKNVIVALNKAQNFEKIFSNIKKLKLITEIFNLLTGKKAIKMFNFPLFIRRLLFFI